MEIIKENKKIIIIAGILVFLTVLLALINGCMNKNKYIYTIKSNNKSKLPHIKIKNEEFNNINKMLEEQYNDIVAKKNESYITYKYNVSNNVFSLLVKTSIKEKNSDFIEEMYYSYNYDLQTNEFISKDELLKRTGISKEKVTTMIENSLLKEYQKEINEGYFDESEYSYESFLSDKNYYNIDDNLEVFMKNTKLYGYLNVRNASGYYDKNNCPKTKKNIRNRLNMI